MPQVIGILICIWAIVTQATSALIGAGVILAVFFLYAVNLGKIRNEAKML